jgi:hypothetical protein
LMNHVTPGMNHQNRDEFGTARQVFVDVGEALRDKFNLNGQALISAVSHWCKGDEYLVH